MIYTNSICCSTDYTTDFGNLNISERYGYFFSAVELSVCLSFLSLILIFLSITSYIQVIFWNIFLYHLYLCYTQLVHVFSTGGEIR